MAPMTAPQKPRAPDERERAQSTLAATPPSRVDRSPKDKGRALPLTAYRLTATDPIVTLAPAASARAWMDASSSRFAYRCLPLLMANQAGWFLNLTDDVEAEWNGGDSLSCVTVFGSDRIRENVMSHFGQGILTFRLPYLFRTPRGYDLLVRGPANLFKDGIAPLEGLVESDWATSPFTMNWKITRAKHRIRFAKGEPVAMIVPMARGDLERFDPKSKRITDDPALDRRYRAWFESRNTFLKDLNAQVPKAVDEGWQRDYFQGKAPDGPTAPANEHRTKIAIKPFA